MLYCLSSWAYGSGRSSNLFCPRVSSEELPEAARLGREPSIHSGLNLYDAGSDKLNTETFDSVALWERVNRDIELLRDLVNLFEEQCPVLLDGIQSAIRSSSYADLQKLSHKLKGSLLQFSAQQAAPIASALEEMAKSRKLEGAEQALNRLTAEIGRLLPALQGMIQGDKPAF